MVSTYYQKRQKDWKIKRRLYLFGSLFCMVSAFFLFSKRNDVMPPERLTSLGTLTLRQKPEIDKEPGKYGGYYLKLAFLEIEKPLKISGTNYYCADRDAIVNSFSGGSILQVLVDKNDFHDAYFGGDKIYGLILGNKNYCNLDCANKSFNQNQKIGTVAFGTFTLGCLIAVLLPFKPRLRVSKYKTYDIEPLVIIIIVTIVVVYIFKNFI